MPEHSASTVVAVAADHGGFALKGRVVDWLRDCGASVTDFGAKVLDPDDDYPTYVVPLAEAVARGEFARGIAICGSGVGACITANKLPGVRAATCSDGYSARQGVEDDDMNVLCLGARIVGEAIAFDLVDAFLGATYKALPRYQRRLDQIAELESRGRA